MARVGTPLVYQMADFSDDPQVVDKLVRVYRAYNEAIHDERIAAFDGVPQMMADLCAKGFELGLVTSKRRGLAVRGLEVLGLAGYLRAAVGMEDTAKHKPEPEPVLLGCKMLDLEPSACVYVGDSPFDIAAGNAAGCITVAVTWGMFGEDELRAQGPDYVIAHPNELAPLLSQVRA